MFRCRISEVFFNETTETLVPISFFLRTKRNTGELVKTKRQTLRSEERVDFHFTTVNCAIHSRIYTLYRNKNFPIVLFTELILDVVHVFFTYYA